MKSRDFCLSYSNVYGNFVIVFNSTESKQDNNWANQLIQSSGKSESEKEQFRTPECKLKISKYFIVSP